LVSSSGGHFLASSSSSSPFGCCSSSGCSSSFSLSSSGGSFSSPGSSFSSCSFSSHLSDPFLEVLSLLGTTNSSPLVLSFLRTGVFSSSICNFIDANGEGFGSPAGGLQVFVGVFGSTVE
jgi:hypothetical protein